MQLDQINNTFPETTKTEVGPSPIKIKKLGHVVYEVSDIERSTQFWTNVLGFTISDRNELGMVFLRCASDHHTIALKPAPGKVHKAENDCLSTDHFAMEVESLEVLLAAKKYFLENDIPIVFEGRRGPGCNIGIEFLEPDGYMLEIYWGMDQIGKNGLSRPSSQYRRASSLEEALANPLPKW